MRSQLTAGMPQITASTARRYRARSVTSAGPCAMDASVLVYRCRSKAGGAHSRATISFGTYVRNVSLKGLPSGDGNQFDSAMSATGFGPTAIFKEPSDSFCSGRMVVQVEALQ